MVSTGIQGGTEFYFAPFRNPGQVLLLMSFTAVWTGMIYFMLHMHAPWFFPVVFGFFDFLLIYAVVRSALGSFHIEVGDGKIVFRRALLGFGTAREIAFPDIARVLTVTGLQQQGARASYSVCLYTKDGSKVTLADAIEDRQEARWVVAQIEKLAGLKLDTHVAVQGGLALNSPPPQRARFGTGSPLTVRRNSRLAMVVGLAFIFAWAGFVGYKLLSKPQTSAAHSQGRGCSARAGAGGGVLAADRCGHGASANASRTGTSGRIAGAVNSARSPRARNA